MQVYIRQKTTPISFKPLCHGHLQRLLCRNFLKNNVQTAQSKANDAVQRSRNFKNLAKICPLKKKKLAIATYLLYNNQAWHEIR